MPDEIISQAIVSDRIPEQCFCGGRLETVVDDTGRFRRCADCQKEMVLFIPTRRVVVMAEVPAGRRLTASVRPDTEPVREYERLAAQTRRIRDEFFAPRTQIARGSLLAIMCATFLYVAFHTLSHHPLGGSETALVAAISLLSGFGIAIENRRTAWLEQQYAHFFVLAWMSRRWVYEEKLASLSGKSLRDFQKNISKE